MRNIRNIRVIVTVAGFALPLAAQAQGIPGGAAQGAQQGGEAAGPWKHVSAMHDLEILYY
jgi:hypothetical protein